MIILDLKQGTAEWLQHRATARNASEAAAVLGYSKHMTRSELIRKKATGAVEEVDWNTQKLFDRGHECEAKARPIVEQITGDLCPITATDDDGYLSASFDGVTFAETIIWENKLQNKYLIAFIAAYNDLPESHWPQVEQQLYISKADYCLFTVCDDDGAIIAQLVYRQHPQRIGAVLSAWRQFDEDLANYQHVEPKPEVVAAPVLDLPSVSVQVSGQIAVINNFDVFEVALRDFIENRLIRKPETDQDFADLDTQIKALKKAEDALQQAEATMLAQVSSIDAMKRTKDMLHKLARDNRLMAEKLLEAEKVARRVAIQDQGKADYSTHIQKLNDRLGSPLMPLLPVDFVGAAKGKRTITSIQDAVSNELARAKIAANEVADRIDTNLKALREVAHQYKFLFVDAAQIVLKPHDDLLNIIKLRISEHEQAEAQRLESEREQIRKEEEAKVRAEIESEAERKRIANMVSEAAKLPDMPQERVAEIIKSIPQQTAIQEQPEPITQAPAVTVVESTEIPTAKRRPTDKQLIFSVATAYNVDFGTAAKWIKDIDFSELIGVA
jgi:predicted phage-related endonuclease